MPKYISGRSKKRPQDQLSDDRYQYLAVDQAEPNLGDPVFPGETPPFGTQYITVSIEGYPGERYWIPNQGGIIPGSITIFDENVLVGGVSSTTQLNFIGAAISARSNLTFKETTLTLRDSETFSFNVGLAVTQLNSGASGVVKYSTTNSGIVTITNVTGSFTTNATDELYQDNVGIAKTPLSATSVINASVASEIEVSPEYFSSDKQLIFNNNDEFDGAVGFIYQNNGATESNVGLASVGIGTTFARRTLHVDGDIKLTGSIEDYNNSRGNLGDLLVKNDFGGIEWTDQRSVSVGAAGTIYEVQFHGATGYLNGADKLVYRSDLNGGQIGIGSTIPTKLLDVLGDSIFTGDVTFDGNYPGNVRRGLWDRSEKAFIVQDHAYFGAGTGKDLRLYHDATSSYITNNGGHLYIQNTAPNFNNFIYIKNGEKNLIVGAGGGQNWSVSLYHNNVLRLDTTSAGINVTGTTTDDGATHDGDVTFKGSTANYDALWSKSDNSFSIKDNAKLKIGTNGDVEFYHDASNTYISPVSTGVGTLIVGSATTDIAKFAYNGGVSLYYQDVLKFDTIGAGVTVYNTAYIPNLITVGIATIDKVRIGYDNDNTIDTSDGNLILDSAGGTIQVKDVLHVDDTTESSSKDTGSIYTEGGVGIEKNLNVGQNVGIAGSLKVTGITTLGVTTASQLYVSGITTLGVTTLTNVTAQQLNVSGITTLGVTTASQLYVSGITTLGVTTASQLQVSGMTTLGVTTLTDTTTQQLFVSGISTLGNVFIQPIGTGASVGEKEPGVSGVVTFYGDGSGLRNVVAIGTGIDIQNSGTSVGSANTVNFGNNLTGSLEAGVYTVNAADAPEVDVYWVKNISGIHTLGNVGIGSVYPTEKLDVIGNAKFKKSEINFNDFCIIGNGTQEWYIPDGYERQLSPQVGTALSVTVGANATRKTDAQLYDYIWDNYDAFDLDGDGIVSYLDIILLYRYRVGITASSLISPYVNVWSNFATRNTGSEIYSFIQSNLSTYDVDGNGNFSTTSDIIIIMKVFGAALSPTNLTPDAYEAFDFSNDAFLNPDDGGGAQFRINRTVGIGTTALSNTETRVLEVYGKVSIADTTSNAGGARYISTEAPTAGVGQEGDIWYDVSSTADTAGTNGNIPVGGIIMWYGTIANIPASWALCDGTSYSTAIGTIVTPDLRDRFVVGAATTLTVNSTDYPATNITGTGTTIGGSKDSTLISHSHTHTLASGSQGSSIGAADSNPGGTPSTVSTSTEGSGTGSNENLPPYYALAYIMRIL